ncbi:unnamed protein product [Diamesa serratosioi]
MKSVLVIVLAVLAVVSAEKTAFIVGGQDATVEDHPYMAAVLNLGLPGCGGAIISTRSVLTAAHCILINSPLLVSVSVGSSRRNGDGGTRYRVVRILIHPEYNLTTITNDVAVLRTLFSITFGPLVQPIALGSAFVPPFQMATVTGWGLTGDSSLWDRPAQLQMLQSQTISNSECTRRQQGTDVEYLNIAPHMLCVINNFGQGACNGDSGSPLTINGEVVGIVSWGNIPCGNLFPVVYMRVASFRAWISSLL